MMRKIMLVLLCFPTLVWAECTGRLLNPVTDICWSCLFPLAIGNIAVVKSKVADTPNPSNPVCYCQKGNVPQIGLTVGFWEPARLIEVVREPYCFPTLGGLQLNHNIAKYGSVSNQKRGFYHVHYFVYPLLYALDVLTDGLCVEQAELDVAYLSELDPTWNDPALAFIVNPEAAVFNNPMAIAACSEDCIAASHKLSNDKLFWCAGCQGSLFPLTGQVQHQTSGVQASLLLVERMLYKLHRQGLLWQTAGTDETTLCYKKPQPILHKSQYRTQMVYPRAVTQLTQGGCMPLGHTSATWEANKQFPIQGEDFAYLIFRKRNCCSM